MNRRARRVGVAGGIVGLAAVVVAISATSAMASPQLAMLASRPTTSTTSVDVVASGLSNPRELTFGPGGVLYVAESGRGGDGPCFTDPNEEHVQNCFGRTGSVTAVYGGRQWRVVTGLPSVARAGGQGANGLTDITFNRYGLMFGVFGLGGPPQVRDGLGSHASALASISWLVPGVGAVKVADLGQYEATQNPDGRQLDTNPYSLAATGDSLVAVDAAGNDVVRMDATGALSTVSALPWHTVPVPFPPGTIEEEPVPTTITVGPDGAYYVGEFPGFPFAVSGARVVRVDSSGQVTEVASGLTNIIDIAFDQQGRMLVLEFVKGSVLDALFGGDATAALIRVEQDGTQTELIPGRLTFASGLTVGPDGSIYVTNQSISPDSGEVLRVRA
ncbi:MAG TPA: ScyD/ScyE family protein [Micromonosporaceae bacterium]